jgi:hypothetical protein
MTRSMREGRRIGVEEERERTKIKRKRRVG